MGAVVVRLTLQCYLIRRMIFVTVTNYFNTLHFNDEKWVELF